MKKDLKEKLQAISTEDGAFKVLKPIIERVTYAEVKPDSKLRTDLKMDSLDVLEVLNNVEKLYTEEYSETIFGEEWNNIETIRDLVNDMVEFAKAKLAKVEKIEIASEKVRREIEKFLSRFSKREVHTSNTLKELGVPAVRIKEWAEEHFGFEFSQEDMNAKTKTVEDLYCLVIKYYDQMA